jgi:vacuolar-type H+-ATPase subunit E/Vma4
MSAEKIIEQIQKDAEKEIKQIQKEVDEETKKILEIAKKQANIEAEKILENSKKQAENTKRIIISKENQNVKREIMSEKEKIIEDCFVKAQHNLSEIKGKEYEETIKKYIDRGLKKLGKDCIVLTSRAEDKKIIENAGLKSTVTIKASGGIKLVSKDGQRTLDYTFEGIIKRNKHKIRNKVGILLFSK